MITTDIIQYIKEFYPEIYKELKEWFGKNYKLNFYYFWLTNPEDIRKFVVYKFLIFRQYGNNQNVDYTATIKSLLKP